MTGRRCALIVCGLLFTTPGCRDTIQPFVAADALPIDPTPRRLTYSPGDDRSPAWSARSDSIYYSASRTDVDRSEGVLMSIHRLGGVARPLLPGQLGRTIPSRLVEPAPAPSGPQLAFLELRPLHSETACAGDSIACTTGRLESPRLDEVWVRTAPDARAATWPTIGALRFEGGARATLDRMGGFVVFESTYTPAQTGWAVERALPSKPSLSVTGRMATADDEGIHIIEPDGTVTLLATGDVANPAWSPGGEWLAFDRVERLDTIMDLCVVLAEDRRRPGTYQGVCYERRIFYQTTTPVVVMIRPDGSDETTVGPGADPEWHPDGESLVYVTQDRVVRHFLQTAIVEPVAATDGGREPVVSPDGRWIAFTRFDEAADGHDVWVVSLEE